MAKKYAAIDIGSNAARLLIGELAEENGHQFVKKISYTRLPLRLGEEVFEFGEISERKKEDFIKAMKAFSYISDIFDVDGVRACATSAMRDAKNGKSIMKSVKLATGIEIEIISGDEEARLIFGTFQLLAIEKSQNYAVIDVGGGSTEITVFEKGEKVASKSFQIGTVRMLKEKVSEKDWVELKDWLDKNVDLSEHRIYGTGGNINKIHKIVGNKETVPVKLTQLNSLKKALMQLSVSQRMEAYRLKPDRADVIVPALEIYSLCMQKMHCSEIYVPKVGLSDGMILDLATQNRKI